MYRAKTRASTLFITNAPGLGLVVHHKHTMARARAKCKG